MIRINALYNISDVVKEMSLSDKCLMKGDKPIFEGYLFVQNHEEIIVFRIVEGIDEYYEELEGNIICEQNNIPIEKLIEHWKEQDENHEYESFRDYCKSLSKRDSVKMIFNTDYDDGFDNNYVKNYGRHCPVDYVINDIRSSLVVYHTSNMKSYATNGSIPYIEVK